MQIGDFDMKNIKIYFAVIAFVFVEMLLNGCTYQANRRPKYDDSIVWVCQSPRIELYWSNSEDTYGKIYIKNKEIDLFHVENPGSGFDVYKNEASNCYFTADGAEEYLLFKSRANYNYDTFTLQVEEDRVNMFDGELPLLKFKCYKKSEYFKDKKGDK